jgi:hypothetical protein
MDGLSLSLLLAAAGVGVVHTLLGPDHYLPFITLARARHWSRPRTLATVGICGLGHVLGSVVLGVVGLAGGAAIGQIENLESGRGDWAAWCMVVLGLAYGVWGLRRALRRPSDIQPHVHGSHVHIHRSGTPHHHHAESEPGEGLTFWMLLLVFILGPCEPLIPLFVLPASRGRWDLALATVVVFAIATVLTMLCVTAIGLAGLSRIRLGPLERWGHAIAGATVAASGLAVITLGL